MNLTHILASFSLLGSLFGSIPLSRELHNRSYRFSFAGEANRFTTSEGERFGENDSTIQFTWWWFTTVHLLVYNYMPGPTIVETDLSFYSWILFFFSARSRAWVWPLHDSTCRSWRASSALVMFVLAFEWYSVDYSGRAHNIISWCIENRFSTFQRCPMQHAANSRFSRRTAQLQHWDWKCSQLQDMQGCFEQQGMVQSEIKLYDTQKYASAAG